MTQPDDYYPDTAINASTGFSAYSQATQADWEAQMRHGWLRTINPLQWLIDSIVNFLNQIPVLGPMIATAILGIESRIEDLFPWFVDLRWLLGDPTGMGTGDPKTRPIENIPILGGVVTYLEGVPLIGPLVAAITGELDRDIGFLGDFFSDVFMLMGNPLGLGSGTPTLPALTSIPLLGPLIEWIQTYLINPILGGTTHTLEDLGSALYTGVTQASSAVTQWEEAITAAAVADATAVGTALQAAGANLSTAVDYIVANVMGIIGGGFGLPALGNAFGQQATIIVNHTSEIRRLWAKVSLGVTALDDFDIATSDLDSLSTWEVVSSGVGTYGKIVCASGTASAVPSNLNPVASISVPYQELWAHRTGADATTDTDYQTITVNVAAAGNAVTSGAVGYLDVLGRIQDTSNFIRFRVGTDRSWEVSKFVSGTETVMFSGTLTFDYGAGTDFTLVCGDNVNAVPRYFKAMVNGTVLCDAAEPGTADSNYGATYRDYGWGGTLGWSGEMTTAFGGMYILYTFGGYVGAWGGMDTPP